MSLFVGTAITASQAAYAAAHALLSSGEIDVLSQAAYAAAHLIN
ncbi:hypothetical protein [Photobacterium leiognathi]